MASAGNLKASLKWGVGSENWEGRGEAQDRGAAKGPPTNGGVSRVKSAPLGLIEVCMLQLTCWFAVVTEPLFCTRPRGGYKAYSLGQRSAGGGPSKGSWRQ